MASTMFIHFDIDQDDKLSFQLINVRRIFGQWEIILFLCSIRYKQDASNNIFQGEVPHCHIYPYEWT